MEQEHWIGYSSEGYTLVNQQGGVVAVLRVGDTLDVLMGNVWQRVRVESGGYKGWYYVTADGRPTRFAVAMQVRGSQAALCPVVAAELEQRMLQASWSAHLGKRVRGVKRGVVVASVETLPSGVQLLHLARHDAPRKEQTA